MGRLGTDFIRLMHIKNGLAYSGPPKTLDKEERNFRIACLQEELDEYRDADNIVDEYDALVDLLVFLLGTFYRQGLPVKPGFDAVMKCNMEKEVGQNGDKRGGYKADLVKPEGWVGPEDRLRAILRNCGFEFNEENS